MAVETRQRRAKPGKDRSLDIGSIAIGMRDAYYHFPLLLTQKDLALLACKFALAAFEILHKDQKQQRDITNIIDNYTAGYRLGSQQCNNMDCKEHKRTLAQFHKVESEEGDTGLYLVFGSFKEEIEDFVLLRDIKDIDDFNSKMEKGELVWQSN
jgi:hypothetical protein